MSSVKNVIKDNYNMMLLRDYLRDTIKDAGFSHAEISKTPIGTRVALHVTKPGIVIGRKGLGIRELTEKLGTDFGLKNPQVTVNEITAPELSPSVMCNRMAGHIEYGTAFRRATMWTLRQIMDGGAMGVQITISGKLRGDRSAFEKHTAGILPRAGHHAEVIVDEDIAHVKTPMGLIGIRIRIARKEKYVPEFKLKPKGKKKSSRPKEKKDVKDAQDISGSKADNAGDPQVDGAAQPSHAEPAEKSAADDTAKDAADTDAGATKPVSQIEPTQDPPKAEPDGPREDQAGQSSQGVSDGADAAASNHGDAGEKDKA